MLKNDGWRLAKGHKPMLSKLISSNIINFKAFARDIQRLIFFSKLEYSEAFTIDNTLNKKEVTIDMIERAMKIFIENDIDHKSSPSVEPTNDSLRNLLKLINDNPDLSTNKVPNQNMQADSFKFDSSDATTEDFYDMRKPNKGLQLENENRKILDTEPLSELNSFRLS